MKKINEYMVNGMAAIAIIGTYWLLFGGGALNSPSYGWVFLLEVTK